jgi:hypothetical protein
MSKKISINPAFFKIAKKDRPTKEKKAKISSKNLKANDIKKKLIAKIKEHQQKEKDKEIKELEKEKHEFKSDFTETIQYLEELKNKKQKERQNKTLKKKNKSKPQIKQNISVDTKSMVTGIAPAPPYGILKNGNKPTWRQYNKTLKKENTPIIQQDIFKKPLIQLFDNKTEIDQFSERKNKLDLLKKKLNPEKKKKIKTRRLRRKITLGKEKNKVGVLIKSKKTRKNIKNEISVLKKKSIGEVKEYLRKHNLIKIGSNAPDYILRTTYENAYLSGDVLNKNPDILLHNWHKDT